MKFKKFILGAAIGLLGLSTVLYAGIIQPNIGSLPAVTSIDPNTFFLMVQSGSTISGSVQNKISAHNLGVTLGLSGFLTGFTESDPVWMADSGNYIPRSGGTMPGNMIINGSLTNSIDILNLTDFLVSTTTSYEATAGDNRILLNSGITIEVDPAQYGFQMTTSNPLFRYDVAFTAVKDFLMGNTQSITLDTLNAASISMYESTNRIDMQADTGIYLDSPAIRLSQQTGYDCLGTDSNGDVIDVPCTVGGPYLLIANSGTYYTNNPLGYITGGALSGYLTGGNLTPYLLISNSGTYFNAHSGDYYTSNPLGYITGGGQYRTFNGTILKTTITAPHAAILGYGSTSSGLNAVSAGTFCAAKGDYSTCLGSISSASGNQSTAIGYQATSNGLNSVAIGNATAGAVDSVAIGNLSVVDAAATQATTLGYGLRARGIGSTVVGSYNIGITTAMFEVGVGTGGSRRHNALTIFNTGLAQFNYGIIDAGGNPYITGVNLASYLLIANSGTYFNANSGTYFNANSGTYYTNNPLGYVTGGQCVLQANSGTYFNANSGTYYTNNPLGYITGGALSPYLLIASGASFVNLSNYFVPFYSGTNLYNTNMSFANNNIGIKTTNPQVTLDVSGSVQSNVAFMLTGGLIPWKIVVSGTNLSFQAFTGGVWTEISYLTP